MTKVSCKRRRTDLATLFAGNFLLYKKVHKIQFATQIVGDVFERMSHAIAGPQWHRLSPRSEDDVRPDLGTEDELNFVESKATQWRFKVTTKQLGCYKELVEDNAKLKQNCSVVYYLWRYGDKTIRLVKPGKTVGDIVQELVDNVVSLDIVHWSIMHAMRTKLPKGITYKEYPSWKRSITDKEIFKVMQFGMPFLSRLNENPAKTLFSELSLNPECYDLQTGYKKRCVRSFILDGVKFTSRPFRINRYVPVAGYVECPEFQSIRDEIAF